MPDAPVERDPKPGDSIVCMDYPNCQREHAGGAGGVPVHPPADARISGDEPIPGVGVAIVGRHVKRGADERNKDLDYDRLTGSWRPTRVGLHEATRESRWLRHVLRSLRPAVGARAEQ